MDIIKLMSIRVLGTSLLLTMTSAYAQQDQNKINSKNYSEKTAINHTPDEPYSNSDSHLSEHGGQIHQSTEVETKWHHENGHHVWHSQLESRIGTDENQLFVQVNIEKAESEKPAYDTKVMYDRAISEFWNAQIGLRHYRQTEQQAEKNQTYAAIGLHGLAPYFFDSDLYLYAGKDRQFLMTAEFERDILITQKLITQPYLHSEIVLSDDSKYAKKTGLNHVSAGVETRYEINKQVMPFVEIGYKYEKGRPETLWQEPETYSHGWLYGAGIKFLF